MGAVLSSIPLCSRAGDTATQSAQETDNRPEDRQQAVTVVAQPLSVQLQSDTSETCTATGIDNENHQEDQEITEKTNQAQDVEQLQPPAVEEPSQEPEPEPEEEDDGNVEVSLDDSQSDEWNLEKDVEVEGESQEKVEVEEEEEEDQDHYRKTSPELDTAAAITNILSEIVGGDSNDSR